jgi:hypothetical protein
VGTKPGGKETGIIGKRPDSVTGGGLGGGMTVGAMNPGGISGVTDGGAYGTNIPSYGCVKPEEGLLPSWPTGTE